MFICIALQGEEGVGIEGSIFSSSFVVVNRGYITVKYRDGFGLDTATSGSDPNLKSKKSEPESDPKNLDGYKRIKY